jgi:phosphoenolpyruvate carboxykinase (ATP)
MSPVKTTKFFTGGDIPSSLLFTALERSSGNLHHQLPVAALVEEGVRRGESILTDTGALRATTGKYTGRSPRDKFLVDDPVTHDLVDWGKVNQPMSSDAFDALAGRMAEMAAGRDLFVFDGFAGADPNHQLPIRVVTEYAWHSLFAHQLFIRPEHGLRHAPGTEYFLVVDLPSFKAEPERDGTNSETVIALDLERRICLIGGTEYAGEIKKSIFTVLNFLLPQQGVFPMHCSANAGSTGAVALFFGLSGTGKTTLSADPDRDLIGDDEHGWSDTGVFNFEGGCYAKCIRLRRLGEPEIWNAIKFGSVLENVVVDPETRMADYDDTSLTENTRCAYPIDYIPHALIPGVGGHPRAILFLTADAFGVLPPISRLTREQAMYHFLSGYTSKLAGTERGVTAPEPNFSACFGAPFWPLPPTEYAHMLGERLDAHVVTCFLVNTGWSGGAYGVGSRIDLKYTRAMVHAALAGELDTCPTVTDPVFGLHIPTEVAGVPDSVLLPWVTWPDRTAYDGAAAALAQRFHDNFAKFTDVDEAIRHAGPRISWPKPQSDRAAA